MSTIDDPKRKHRKKVQKPEEKHLPKRPRIVKATKNYDKNFKLAQRKWPRLHSDVSEFLAYIKNRKAPPEKYKVHQLKGDRKGTWDAHIKGDLVLLYTLDDNHITLVAIGSHNQLNI